MGPSDQFGELSLFDPGPRTATATVVTDARVARLPLGRMGEGVSPFPYALMYGQDEHERLLASELGRLGVSVERRTELLGFEASEREVRARLKRPDGSEERAEAAYLAGCDGAHSAARNSIR